MNYNKKSVEDIDVKGKRPRIWPAYTGIMTVRFFFTLG